MSYFHAFTLTPMNWKWWCPQLRLNANTRKELQNKINETIRDSNYEEVKKKNSEQSDYMQVLKECIYKARKTMIRL